MKLDTIYKFKPQLGESTFFKGKLGLFKNNDYITILKDPSYNELQGKTHLLRFNTSNETAYTIAKKILDYADRLNKGV